MTKLDRSLAIRMDQRIQRLADGNPAFHKRFDNLLEVKWATGAMGSFRVYCFDHKDIILLLGGHKDTQGRDIAQARKLMKGIIDGKISKKIYE